MERRNLVASRIDSAAIDPAMRVGSTTLNLPGKRQIIRVGQDAARIGCQIQRLRMGLKGNTKQCGSGRKSRNRSVTATDSFCKWATARLSPRCSISRDTARTNDLDFERLPLLRLPAGLHG